MNAIRNDIIWNVEKEQIMRDIRPDYDWRKNGITLDEVRKALCKFGILPTQLVCSSLGTFPEITAYLLDPVKFNSAFKIRTVPRPQPKKVIFSGPATTILWMDGTKTTVKCQDEDAWDNEVGIAMCYLKKLLGNKGNYNNIFREAMKVAEVQYKKEDLVYGEVESISVAREEE